MGRIFGTDGVRGLANAEITPELAVNLGRSLAEVLREQGEARPEILVGRDPRWSGEMLEAACVAGITAGGGDAVVLGVVPTPAVAHLVVADGASAGIMISASHNPFADNGLKVFANTGFKLTDAAEDRLEELMDGPTERHTGRGLGRFRVDGRGAARYADALVAAAEADLSGLTVVVDGANGAASAIAPDVYRRLGAEVIGVHCWPDGANINDGCGSTYPRVVCDATKGLGADVGVAHDGDADRLVASTRDGREVDGDVILGILAKHRKEQGTLANDTVVTTVMTNLGFRRAMKGLDIDVVETAVGDRYVLEAMREGGHVLGGEQSGHLIQLDRVTTGDGILSGVTLLSTMAAEKATLTELATVMERLPQVLVNVRGVDKDRVDECDEVWSTIRDVERDLGDDGRVLVRPSGTEPVVRVMVEAPTEGDAQRAADRIADVVAAELALT